MLVYGMSCLGLAMLILDFVYLESSLSLQGYCHVGLALLVFGMVCTELVSFMLDSLNSGPSLFPRSCM